MRACFFLLLLLSTITFSFAADPKLETSVTTAWESRYASEGRDSLGGEGLSSLAMETTYGALTFGTWFAFSDGADYQENQYYARYGFDLGEFSVSIGYLYLDFVSDTFNDNEASVLVTSPELPGGITLSGLWYYSFLAEGSFIELAAERSFELTDKLSLTPAISFGDNEGYFPAGHSGANHTALQLGLDYSINDRLSLGAYAAQNFGIDADPIRFEEDAGLEDFFYGGVSLTVSF